MALLRGGFGLCGFGKGVADLVAEKGAGRPRCWELGGLHNLAWMLLRTEERGHDARTCGRGWVIITCRFSPVLFIA